MSRYILFLLLLFNSLFAESFITEEEYGKYLYSNPRGVSCAACHGIDAKGKVIATYFDNDTPKKLETNAITNLDYKRFVRALRKQKGVMPRYYLSDKETTALYNYIQGL